jgi:inner membrane protein involved in colicin E2 resistance
LPAKKSFTAKYIKITLNSIQSLSQKRKKCDEEVHFSAILMQLDTSVDRFIDISKVLFYSIIMLSLYILAMCGPSQ